MPRPKSIRFVGVKMPDDLYFDMSEVAERATTAARLRDPKAPEKTVSDVIKDCCEFRLTLIKGLRIGYYRLREQTEACEAQSGFTNEQKV